MLFDEDSNGKFIDKSITIVFIAKCNCSIYSLGSFLNYNELCLKLMTAIH